MIRLLITDDSAFCRYSITRLVGTDKDIEIVGYARDGVEALEKIRELEPDVMTLDVEMPRLDGLQTLEKVMTDCPLPVIMVSSLTDGHSDTTVRALELGAIDYFLKASSSCPVSCYGVENTLLDKIKAAAKVSKSKLLAAVGSSARSGRPALKKHVIGNNGTPRKIIAVASSTGGPGALYKFIPFIPADIPAALFVVQHMPVGFTKSLADRLNELSQVSVKEAEDGDRLHEGHVILAKGGYHMLVGREYRIKLTKDPPVLGLRPAADITMSSAAPLYGKDIIFVVLTGMGSDGTRGAVLVKNAGGHVIAQDEQSCIVYGMPRSVVEAGVADKVLPLTSIAEEVSRLCSN
jgi:two-component system chemotaxis response regulator CheB